jgi:adenylate cyclase
MSAELQIIVDGQAPQSVPLGPVCAIGRGPSNDVVLNDNRASRNHAVIRLQDDKAYVLLDLGSSNGTILNNRRISIPSPLKSGDEIQIASSKLVFVDDRASITPVPEDFEMRTQVEFKSETVCILVVDIRNYTGLSEAVPGEDLSRIIGKWFQEASKIIETRKGAIAKFIGDAVMAYWRKAGPDDKNYVLGPVYSAVELVQLASTFHEQVSQTYPNFGFRIGCGINAGKVIVGNAGELVGDSVNIAFRIESLCKELGHPIVLSDEVKLAAGADFQYLELGAQKVKGKTVEVKVYTIHGEVNLSK